LLRQEELLDLGRGWRWLEDVGRPRLKRRKGEYQFEEPSVFLSSEPSAPSAPDGTKAKKKEGRISI